ncbi:hypothetical protein Psta_3308 [Pirellula staleyi DSM 6068]|uniref:Polyhydroxyalkanoic acid system protein n=1 Tax=Pirellula staleyi (strain ATCC 27377 / DSM 6068 / ICPB 4128) TaxID=530564 RepID=D2QXD2_PIRSD|nr:polyhydroxyalkanoic acid system family protein [Pirellula staleyi]ADB17972.1 hypothetical protein Psta_3308 [Pirellula staleyi DSM 6068]
MAGFNAAVPNPVGQSRAKELLEAFIESMRSQYGEQVEDLEGEWMEHQLRFSFTTMGIDVNGNLFVEEKEVRIQGQLPMMAMMFRGTIEQRIKDELNKLLGNTTAK